MKLKGITSRQLSSGMLRLTIVLTGTGIAYIAFNTTPSSVGPTGITVFFILVFLLIFAIMEIFYRRFIKPRKYIAYWLKVAYAFVPVFLLALSSLRQLNSIDLILGGTLLTIVTIYHNRNN